MSELKNNVEALVVDLKDYFSTNVELAKLKASDKTASAVSEAMSQLIITLTLIIGVIFLSTSAAIYIAEQYDSLAIGFLIVGSFYTIIFILLLVVKKPLLRTPLKNKIIKSLLKETDNGDTN